MSNKSRTSHLLRIGQQVPTAIPTAPPICQRCLRELARADLFPIDEAMLALYRDVREGTGDFYGMGTLDHASTMQYMETFIVALASAGEEYNRLTQLEYGAEDTGLTDDQWAEMEAWWAKRDAWRGESDDNNETVINTP